MPLNPLVQRALESRFQVAQPQDTLNQAYQTVQARQQAAMQPAGGTYDAGSTGAAPLDWRTSVGAFGGTFGGGGGSTGDPKIDAIMKTIRARESGGGTNPNGNYTLKTSGWHPTKRTASGAYQITKDTWGGYGGYTYAFQAPKAVQDAKARAMIADYLKRGGNKIEAVPGYWFRSATYLRPNEWDLPIEGNNGLTMRRYLTEWMAAYRRFGGQ